MILQVLVLVAALKIFAGKVFVGKVLENAASASDANYWEFFKYIAGAFWQTHPLVQAAIFIGLGIGALLLRDLGRLTLTYINTLK